MKKQLLPIGVAFLTALGLVGLFAALIELLNLLPLEHISLRLLPIDILVGMTIYLKTSIDFALFTGNLMSKFSGLKNRVAIEVGTALGNGLGTMLVLVIWTFFKEVPLLLFAMILLASFVLLDLAKESIHEFLNSPFSLPLLPGIFVSTLYAILKRIHNTFSLLFNLITPHPPKIVATNKGFLTLFLFAISVPFILGLDDFAGYIPLFSIIHIFGFSVGVIVGHLLLTVSLFAFPHKTVQIIRYPLIQLFGGIVFVGLAIFGIVEAFHVLTPLFIALQK